MSAGCTYVIFDGDNDRWAYAYMRGWKVNDRVEFDFRDCFATTFCDSSSRTNARCRLAPACPAHTATDSAERRAAAPP
jgi:hypothetical protein